MYPKELDGKTAWPSFKAQYVFQEMRRKVIEELRERDQTMGVPENGKVYSHVSDQDGAPQFRVDWTLAAKKHDGAETNHILQNRWDEFTAELRDSELVKIKRPPRVTKWELAQAKQGKVQETVVSRIEADNVVRRRPGRPRKTAIM